MFTYVAWFYYTDIMLFLEYILYICYLEIYVGEKLDIWYSIINLSSKACRGLFKIIF